MKIIICLDDNFGVSFNNRRQSRDRKIIEDICQITDKKVYVAPYSSPLFENFPDRIVLSTDFSECQKNNGWAFVEKSDLSEFDGRIDQIVAYRWNKVYPSDSRLKIDLKSFKLESQTDFAGFSHEKITKEIYTK